MTAPRPPAVPGSIRLHHVGIVVRDADAAMETYRRTVGLEPVAIEEFHGIARVAFLRAGDALLELIEPLTDDTPWAVALRERGEGVHHLAFEVEDLRGAVQALAAAGVRVADAKPARAPGNVLSIHLDPEATGGTVIELVQQIVT